MGVVYPVLTFDRGQLPLEWKNAFVAAIVLSSGESHGNQFLFYCY